MNIDKHLQKMSIAPGFARLIPYVGPSLLSVRIIIIIYLFFPLIKTVQSEPGRLMESV